MDEPEKEPQTPPEPENRFTTVPTPGAFSELESETLTELENKPEKEPRSFPPPWLMCALGICLILTGIALSARSEGGQSQAAGLRQAPELSLRPSPPPRLEKRLPGPPAASEPPEMSPDPSPSPSPEPTPEATDGVLSSIAEVAVPGGTAYDTSWFSDAVLIGDSRMNGFQLTAM